MTAVPAPVDPGFVGTLEASVADAVCAPHLLVINDRDFRAFANALRILFSLDLAEMLDVGAVGSRAEWVFFSSEPIRWFTKASDQKQAALWELIQSRQPGWLRSDRGIGGTGVARPVGAA